MKKFSLKIALSAFALIMFSAVNAQDSESLQYTVIHHEGMQIEVYDSIVDINSGYTIEDYIYDLGFDADEVDVIEISDEDNFNSDDSGIWFINEEETENGFQSHTIEIFLEEGDMNEMGFEFEFDEIMDISDDLIDGEEHIVIVKSLSMSHDEEMEMGDIDIEMLMEEGDGNIMIIDMEGEDQNIEMEMDVRIEKIIDENGEEQTFMWINDEEVDPNEFDGMIEFEEFEVPEGAEFVFITEGECLDNMFIGEDINFTLALVTNVGSEDVEAKSYEVPENIENLTFQSRGSGQYQLGFNSKEPAKTEIHLFDMQGREVYNKNLGDFQGEFSKNLNLDLSTGAYVLNILQDGQRVVKKIIVQ